MLMVQSDQHCKGNSIRAFLKTLNQLNKEKKTETICDHQQISWATGTTQTYH